MSNPFDYPQSCHIPPPVPSVAPPSPSPLSSRSPSPSRSSILSPLPFGGRASSPLSSIFPPPPPPPVPLFSSSPAPFSSMRSSPALHPFLSSSPPPVGAPISFEDHSPCPSPSPFSSPFGPLPSRSVLVSPACPPSPVPEPPASSLPRLPLLVPFSSSLIDRTTERPHSFSSGPSASRFIHRIPAVPKGRRGETGPLPLGPALTVLPPPFSPAASSVPMDKEESEERKQNNEKESEMKEERGEREEKTSSAAESIGVIRDLMDKMIAEVAIVTNATAPTDQQGPSSAVAAAHPVEGDPGTQLAPSPPASAPGAEASAPCPLPSTSPPSAAAPSIPSLPSASSPSTAQLPSPIRSNVFDIFQTELVASTAAAEGPQLTAGETDSDKEKKGEEKQGTAEMKEAKEGEGRTVTTVEIQPSVPPSSPSPFPSPPTLFSSPYSSVSLPDNRRTFALPGPVLPSSDDFPPSQLTIPSSQDFYTGSQTPVPVDSSSEGPSAPPSSPRSILKKRKKAPYVAAAIELTESQEGEGEGKEAAAAANMHPFKKRKQVRFDAATELKEVEREERKEREQGEEKQGAANKEERGAGQRKTDVIDVEEEEKKEKEREKAAEQELVAEIVNDEQETVMQTRVEIHNNKSAAPNSSSPSSSVSSATAARRTVTPSSAARSPPTKSPSASCPPLHPPAPPASSPTIVDLDRIFLQRLERREINPSTARDIEMLIIGRLLEGKGTKKVGGRPLGPREKGEMGLIVENERLGKENEKLRAELTMEQRKLAYVHGRYRALVELIQRIPQQHTIQMEE